MTLYDLLELANWNASIGEIMAAYRDVAMRAHPDRAAEDERDAATLKMQLINGAKEVLSDHHLRRQYHVDGVLPWAA
jgi:curved DNA-binding protein CbpA